MLFALGFLLYWQMALAFAGAIVLVAVKLPPCIARFGWRRTSIGVCMGWAVCAGAAWLLAEAFGRRGCSMLI